MERRLLAAFTDPKRRPRAIMWTGVVLVGLVVFSAVSVIGTSVNWFCTDPCHVVHEDNTKTFVAGTHSQVNCVACHEPVNASPLVFILKKIEVAPDAIPTILGTFHLPMNENNAIAVQMSDLYCTQCHSLATRVVTPTKGIIIDHDAHTARDITCPTCHNRVAHPEEGIEYTLPGDEKHEDWMTMDACFRCHSLEQGGQAPGACSACHPASFDLVPATHDAAGWYTEFGESAGHAQAAVAEAEAVAEATSRTAELPEIEKAVGPVLDPEATVNTCYTCHLKSFCTDCHGVPIPHPEAFYSSHGQEGLADPASCARCHARSAAEAQGTLFCSACHHAQSEPGTAWLPQHNGVVQREGAEQCFVCHDTVYCATCHVSGKEAADAWLKANAR